MERVVGGAAWLPPPPRGVQHEVLQGGAWPGGPGVALEVYDRRGRRYTIHVKYNDSRVKPLYKYMGDTQADPLFTNYIDFVLPYGWTPRHLRTVLFFRTAFDRLGWTHLTLRYRYDVREDGNRVRHDQ